MDASGASCTNLNPRCVAPPTRSIPTHGRSPSVRLGVRFVIILDADTQLPRGAANSLSGRLPLNRPATAIGCVIEGHAVL